MSERSWKLNHQPNIVFVGDSHMEQAINDKVLKEVLTFAQSGDGYLYTFRKLEKLLKDNPEIDTVVLGIDYHNVDSTAVEWYSNRGYLDFKLPYTLSLMSMADLKLLFSINPQGTLSGCINSLSVFNNGVLQNNINCYGSFLERNTTMPKVQLDSVSKSQYLNQKSMIQFRYLSQIKNLCEHKKKTLIFMTTPLYLSANRNEKLQSLIDSFVQENSIRYINLRDLKTEDTFFADKYHLNTQGAGYFTQEALSQIRKHP